MKQIDHAQDFGGDSEVLVRIAWAYRQPENTCPDEAVS